MKRNNRRRDRKAKKSKKASQTLPHPELGEAYRLFQSGDVMAAEKICHQLQFTAPEDPDRVLILAMIAKSRGDLESAIGWAEQAVRLTPNYPEAQNFLGEVLVLAGRDDEARNAFENAVTLNPDFAGAHYQLALIRERTGDGNGALTSFKKAVALRPGFSDAWMEMGNALIRMDRVDEAIDALRQAVLAAPENPYAYYNLGCALERAGFAERPREVFSEAVRLDPGFVRAYYALAGAWKRLNKYREAIESYREAVRLDAGFAEGHASLAGALREMGDVDGARESYHRAMALDPDNLALKIKAALVLPVIPRDVDEINNARQGMLKAVKALRKRGGTIDDAFKEIGVTNFFLAYHEQDDRELQEIVASLMLDVSPSLAWTAPHCREYKPKPAAKKIKLGVCSAFMRHHTLGKLTLGMLKTLSRDDFEVVLIRLPGDEDEMTKRIDGACDKVIPVPYDLEQTRHLIADETLDVLFYPDIGMDPFTYYLAFARLAPVQITSWGHPDTTGIPNMDYFLSCEGMEPDASDVCFSEQLVKLKDVTSYYYKPALQPLDFIPSDHGVADDATLYVCPQTLFKFHPDFDRLIARLLGNNENARLLLIDDPFGGLWRDRLMARFQKNMADSVACRIHFLEKMPLDAFFGLLKRADCVLDVPTFSGGNSSIEAFAQGVPIVTWPGGFLRGRITLACYQQMGVMDLVVDNEDDYLRLAEKLAGDPVFRKKMSDLIFENVHKLFENKDMIREWEAFLKAAVRARSNNSGKVVWPLC